MFRFSIAAMAIAVSACTAAMDYQPAAHTAEDEAFVRRAMRVSMADPEAVQLMDVRSFVAPTGTRLICGKMNAKNALGGYTGYQTFVVIKAASVDYSSPYAKPLVHTGPAAMVDCGGAGYVSSI